MRRTKKLLAIFIVVAIIMSNCFALFSNMVFANWEREIYFDTSDYDTNTKTVTFHVGEANVTVTISGTEAAIEQDGDNGRLKFTEALGSILKLQVSDNFKSETMEIYAIGGDGFSHELPIDENRYVIFSGTEIDGRTGEPHNWGVPDSFHFEIRNRGSNSEPDQPGNNNRSVIQFDTNTFTAKTATFLEETATPVKVTVSGTEATIEKNEDNGKLEFEESLGEQVKFQIDGNYNPESMEIYAADGGPTGFTEILSVDQDGYIIFPAEVIGRGGFHFGISLVGGSPMNNPEEMKRITLIDSEENEITILSNKEVTNSQGITFDKETNTLTIENLNAPDKKLMLHCIGESFKINVVGNNKIGKIEAFTQFDHWPQDIYITGNGTLILNENSEADNAIYMCTYFGRSTLRVGANVTLNLKAKNDVIRLEMVPEEDISGDTIIFEGGKNIQVRKEPFYFHGTRRIEEQSYYKYSNDQECLGNKMLRASDPDGIYIGRNIYDVDENYDPIPETARYQISKYIYSSKYDCYFVDPEFEPEHNHEIVLTPAQLEDSEYSEIKEKNEYDIDVPITLYNSVWLNMTTGAEVYKDSNNKEYVVMHNYVEDSDQVYDFAAIDGTPYYWLTENNTIDVATLEPIIEDRLQDGTYNYVVQGTELTVEPTEGHVHTPKDAVKENEVKATCSKEGFYDEVVYCSECNEEISRTKKTVEKLAHTPKEVSTTKITKATLTKNGVINKTIESKCSVCGEVVNRKSESTPIYYPKTISLSKTSFTYNKKVQKPTVTVKGSDGKVIATSNYTVTYSNKNSKKIGEYTVTITFKGNYTGTKKITYTINPKGTSLSKLTKGSKQFKATWKAQKTETTGYEVQYATNDKFTSEKKKVNIKKNKTTSITVKKLKAKKKYYVRIRTYKTVNGKKFYSGWSKVLNVKTK